ncbi:glycosyltransferase family 2 protein [Vibrio rotiferianus]|uniref:glycosyltransferase family 2 protein n=1 Tax=Vibrio rotiferianus TaxID=190895 RepID=UPI00289460C6|nr:Amylovoran biosynthesis glycosyltransferase AmsB [Vibrio rotiferianus]
MNKVSIIIPAYNSSKSIRETLDSLVMQTFKNFEVIVVDDFSNDVLELEALLGSYKNLNVRLVKHNENKNGAAARNTGISFASGDYIAFLDSDDQWRPEKLERYLEKASTLVDDNYILYSKIEVIKEGCKEKIARPTRSLLDNEHVSEYLFISGELIQTSTIFLKRELAEKILFDNRFIRHQDYDFVIRAQDKHKAKFIFLNEPLTIYKSAENAIGRSISLGESSQYSKYWLGEMSQFMTENAIQYYNFFFLSKKLKAEGRYIKLLVNMFSSYWKMLNKERANHWILNKLKSL